MTSLEEEFKKLLGKRYHLYANMKPFEGPSIRESNKGKSFDDLLESIPNCPSNNESVKQVKDTVNIDAKDFASDIALNLNRLPKQPLLIDNELKENVNDLLEKVDKIIEYLQFFHKQIDEKISKAIDEQSNKI
jgi:hypothetical protein